MAKRAVHYAVVTLATGGALVLAGAAACDSESGGPHGLDIGSLPLLDGGGRRLPDGAILEPDGAVVAGDDDDDTTPNDSGKAPACATGTAAIMSGNATALSGAVKVKGSAWLATGIAGGAAKSKPSLAGFGTGFIGVTQGADDSLEAVKFGTSWSAATPFGVSGLKGSPTLTVAGTTAHVVYSAGPGDNHDYKHGIYDGTNWNAATEDVGTNVPPAPAEHSFGTVSAGLASVGDHLVFAENGSDNGLYARTYAASAWSTPTAVTGAGSIGATLPVTPEVVAVTGQLDAIILYGYKGDGHAVAWASHQTGSATWGNTDTQFISGVLTIEKFAVASLSGTSILLSFRGTDNSAYYTQGTVSDTGVTWTAPTAIGGGAPIAVDSVAAVAKGICGDDAIFAYAAGGAIKTVSLKGTTWSAPTDVPGASGTNVAIASLP